MPKASKVGTFRKRAAVDAAAASPVERKKEEDAKSNLSRGQRKRLAKREQFLKRQRQVLSSLRVPPPSSKLEGLEALKQALLETITIGNSVSSKGDNALHSNPSRKALTVQESAHLGLVLQHPAFQANPFETMREHLKNTLASQAKKEEDPSKKQQEEEAAPKRRRRKKSKSFRASRRTKSR
eukprot:CAMPEP_0116846186 /NCGR_PEP_ID=MMETSP0418-20121206/13693_1 /TAXON_ID=1158023 /ORGANISM="Astrosyne radiata, Strain 13vi08-1A" /LENGTH=181 /DNA_ID=CAMNT_0004477401 /DNA_START=33 /DNA_END=578 /DNA_ORIENTATION=-